MLAEVEKVKDMRTVRDRDICGGVVLALRWIRDRVYPAATENCTNLTNPIPSISIECGDGFRHAMSTERYRSNADGPYYYVIGIFATVVR